MPDLMFGSAIHVERHPLKSTSVTVRMTNDFGTTHGKRWHSMICHRQSTMCLKKTSEDSMYYVGHSQGTEIMFALLAEDQRFAAKIRQFHALAPVATVSHIGGLFRLFGERLTILTEFLLHRIPNSPFTLPKILQKMISYLCSLPIARGVCTLDIGFIDGKETQMNKTRIGVYLCHTPAPTSAKNILHWIQIVKSRKCEKFDYGPKGNMQEYGQKTPPVFDLRKITTPTYLYWSKDDILADTEDIRETILSEMNATIRGSYELPHYTHLDFVFGINATNDVYQPIVDRIRHDFIDKKYAGKQSHIVLTSHIVSSCP
ncbi:hypothetical protein KIN20_035221 [Parelaphostrongylus tenuis]|uniref:Uncharacterized protein n=1 Tax=Parelaphostrongylus tenuis TaxID=148309 RepID=A0AAD5RAU9_PARTN|nr:hypothetical protein KIN20_035221 [Parelaphostrongylus tenuis]